MPWPFSVFYSMHLVARWRAPGRCSRVCIVLLSLHMYDLTCHISIPFERSCGGFNLIP